MISQKRAILSLAVGVRQGEDFVALLLLASDHFNLPCCVLLEGATMREIDPTKNMAQLVLEHPQLARILWQQGIECAECMASQVDTLKDVARMYKLDLNLLIKQVHLLDETAGKSSSPG